METFWQDLRYGWRTLRRNPGFAVVAIVTLAIGIGANVTIFSVINGVLLRPLPFPDSKQLVTIWETDSERNIVRGTASPAEFLDWQEMSHSFQSLSGWRGLYFTITGSGDPERVWGSEVSGNFFRMLKVTPALGRDFEKDDEQPGHEPVVILTDGLWRRHFGADPGVVGKTIELDGKPATVVGVLPKSFSLYGTSPSFDIWRPFAFDRAKLDREDHELVVFGRLAPGATIARAQTEMRGIQEELKRKYPGIDQKNGLRVTGFHDELVSSLRPGLLLLLAAVGFLLLIASANVANLMLARAATREREIAVRSSLGAGRNRILRQLLTESFLLAMLGAVIGIIFAVGGLHLLRVFLPPPTGRGQIPHPEWIQIDATVLAFTIAIAFVTSVIFGLAPSVQIARARIYESLKEGGSRGTTSGRRSQFIRSSLIVSEVGFSVVLLVGACLLVRSFSRMMSEDLGFNPSNLLTMQIFLSPANDPTTQSVSNFYGDVLGKVEALPGVQSASAVNFLPLTGWNVFCNFEVEGHPITETDEQPTTQYRVADWRYFETMGIAVKEGRGFTAADGPNTQGVAIINETLARRYWPGQDPVGQQVKLIFPATRQPWDAEPRAGWLTVVGIVADARDWAWGEAKAGQMYLPLAQDPSRMVHLTVRSKGDPNQLTAGIRHAVEASDPNQPVTDVRSMDGYLEIAVAQRRLNMSLLAFFATVAGVLAAIGIYGVMGYAVEQRSHEIGIRMALGARPDDVVRMIIRDGMKLALLGLAMGLIGSLIAMKYLESQLYGIKARDPITFAGVAVALGLVALAACYIPARRATKVDPLSALRYE
jgi:putative ABC transport system permease protein